MNPYARLNPSRAVPSDLDARIHEWIVSGEFQAWRRRTARSLSPEPMRAANGRDLKRCTFPDCKEFYQVTPGKRTPYCRLHALQRREANKRMYHMAPCAFEGCCRMIYVVRNRTGFCALHAMPTRGRGKPRGQRMSDLTRARISEAAKRRWAKWRLAKADSERAGGT